ncbi:hypothetical protein DID88_007377 [Monilinia fructigena]|uniref:Carboxymethylenebutenolidase n=1 Tax=Monilinia fructigena TaxID=38457 RepID=A0A395J948_9HELO|nr:hypothetical protein DID88_007377 [Monilinia fructigena]
MILTSESYSSRAERKTLDPEPCQKWAEEVFVIVNVTIPDQELKAGQTSLESYLDSGLQALKSSPECTDPDRLGLIFYTENLDGSVHTDIVFKWIHQGIFLVAIIFTDDSKKLIEKLENASMPSLMVHSSKSLHGLSLRPDDVAHIYDATESSNFILPSHSAYDPGLLPYVNHIPTMTGGIGRGPLTEFYSNHFVFNNPEDTKLELVSRTVGVDRVIDEFIFNFTHDRVIDWLLPGVPPTHKHVRIPFTSVVNIRGDRLYHEHIAWDQATVLQQLGLLPEYLPFPYPLPDGRLPAKGKRFEYRVPTAGVETAQKLIDESSVVSNGLFGFDIREVDDI